jgi:transposase
VSASAAIKLVRRVRETGSTAPARIGGYRPPLLAGQEGVLRELTAASKGITLVELRAALAERGIKAGSLTTLWSTLRRLGLRHKKVAEGDRAGSAGRGRAPRPLAGVAALHGSGQLRVPG